MGGSGGFSWDLTPVALSNGLRELGSRFQARLGEISGAAAEMVVEQAQSLAPVDTGELRDSIQMHVDEMVGRAVAHITVDAPHGVYQEFGTVYQAAQPYLRPALEQVAPYLVDRVNIAFDETGGGVF